MLLLGVFEWILDSYNYKEHQCGIPVIWWIQVLFLISYGKGIVDLNLIWIARVRYSWVLRYRILSMLCQSVLGMVWTIYGFQLYFSADNNCQQYSETQMALILMAMFLFFGTIGMISFIVLLITVPLLFLYMRNIEHRGDVP